MKRLLVFFSVMLLMYGCAYPTSSVRVLDDRPSLVLKNAPQDAVLLVDGLDMGQASLYDGREKALLLEPGTHKVEVMRQGTLIHSEKIFLGDGETKTINVNSERGTSR